jgi:hypothetical protein
MATSYSPKIITDGLVFMYDTDDGKSYKGEPTTNLITSNGIDFSQMSTYGTLIRSRVSDSNSPSGYACEMEYPNSSLNSASRIRFGDSTNIPTSGNAFVSIMAKFEGGPSSNIYPRIYSGSSWQTLAPLDGGLTYLTSEYRRFGVNAYLGTGSGGPLPAFSMTQSNSNNQAGQKTRWHSPQVELKSHATPYVDGTRSATQGLLDRTSTSTINISNASFDSNAQMTFDGTDDYIEVPNTNLPAPSTNLTMECVFQRDSGRTIINYGPSGFNTSKNYGFECLGSNPALRSNINTSSGSTQIIGTTVINSNTKYYGAMTYDGSSVKLYVNGKLEASASKSGSILNSSTPSLNIGRKNSGNGEYINGEIPIVRIYNRALTAAEVLQNYNAIKSRFQ